MTKRQNTLILTPDELALIRRQIAISRDVLERYADEAEGSQATYRRFLAFEQRHKKSTDEILYRLERLEKLAILDRAGNNQSAETREIKAEIRQELTSLEWRLSRHIANLQFLEEQAAGYGKLQVPLFLINSIADEQEAIQELQLKKRELGN